MPGSDDKLLESLLSLAPRTEVLFDKAHLPGDCFRIDFEDLYQTLGTSLLGTHWKMQAFCDFIDSSDELYINGRLVANHYVNSVLQAIIFICYSDIPANDDYVEI